MARRDGTSGFMVTGRIGGVGQAVISLVQSIGDFISSISYRLSRRQPSHFAIPNSRMAPPWTPVQAQAAPVAAGITHHSDLCGIIATPARLMYDMCSKAHTLV